MMCNFVDKPIVLVVDDELGIRLQIEGILQDKGFDVSSASSYNDAISLLKEKKYEAVVVDLNLEGDKSGIDVLRVAMKHHHGRIPFAIISAHLNQIDSWGARLSNLFVEMGQPLQIQIEKPGFENELKKWANAILDFLHKKKSAHDQNYHVEDRRIKYLVTEIVPMAAASSSLPVLILGESGTGKEKLARLIHDDPKNPHRSGPFVAVNCAAISDTLILSELFGHVKNSFTGAEEHRLGWFLEASGWKHEPLSARKANEQIQVKLLERFGLRNVKDLHEIAIGSGNHKVQMRELKGFLSEIYELGKKLGGIDDFISWLRKNGNELSHVSKISRDTGNDNKIERMGNSYKIADDELSEYVCVTNAAPGTLFLDEIGDLSPAAEVALLRALDGYGVRPLGYTGPALLPNCRIIAATNRIQSRADLRNSHEINRDSASMRKDLFYRLEGWVMELPALRDRKLENGEYEWPHSMIKWAADDDMIIHDADLKLFIEAVTEKNGKNLWDGNYRELRHVYARARIAADQRPGNRIITMKDLTFATRWVLVEGSVHNKQNPGHLEKIHHSGQQAVNSRWTLDECVGRGKIVQKAKGTLYNLLVLLFATLERDVDFETETAQFVKLRNIEKSIGELRRKFQNEHPEAGWEVSYKPYKLKSRD